MALVFFAGIGCNHDKEIKQRNICISNLRTIDAAKNEWAIEKHKGTNDVPTWADIQQFLPPYDSTEESMFGTIAHQVAAMRLAAWVKAPLFDSWPSPSMTPFAFQN